MTSLIFKFQFIGYSLISISILNKTQQSVECLVFTNEFINQIIYPQINI